MPRRKYRSATTDEERELQLISKAYDFAERQMDENTASSQIVTHFLKAGSTRERLEKDRLKRDNELLKAKVEDLQSRKRVEERMTEVLQAMRKYSGVEAAEAEDEDDYY